MAEPTRYRLVIADDHPLFRGALREAVSGLFEEVEIAEAGSFDDVAALLERGGEVDLILLDLTMPGCEGSRGSCICARNIRACRSVVVSANDDPAVIRRCVEFGAWVFIPKTLGIEAIRAAIARVLEGGGVWTPPDIDLGAGSDAETADLMTRLASLTPQQVRVLMMLSEGLLNKQIAYELSVSEATVKAHVSAILQKLGVESRTQAVIAASKIELGQWPQDGRPALTPPGRAQRASRTPAGRHLAAATRCMRHCVSSARSAAGLTGLLSSWMPCARASSRTCGLRSAVIRMAGRSAPKRRRSVGDGVDAVAVVEVVVDQEAVERGRRRRYDAIAVVEIGRDHAAAPAGEQRLHAVEDRRVVVDAQRRCRTSCPIDRRPPRSMRGAADRPESGTSTENCEPRPPAPIAARCVWSSTRAIRSTIDRPRPRPRATLAPCSRRWNSLKIALLLRAGMPRPVS